MIDDIEMVVEAILTFRFFHLFDFNFFEWKKQSFTDFLVLLCSASGLRKTAKANHEREVFLFFFQLIERNGKVIESNLTIMTVYYFKTFSGVH